MKKWFDWTRYDIGFLKRIIAASPRAEEFANKLADVDEDDIDRVAGMMNQICPEPDRNFIVRYRTEIEQGLLRNYPEVCKEVFRNMRIPRGSVNERLAKLYEKPASAALAACYIRAIQQIGGYNVPMTEYSKFKFNVPVDMQRTEIEDVPLYPFQKEASDRMKKYYIDENGQAGMLVMPTGSGKSRTATTFLIREMISRGYQVLWLAHRHMLIDQAADCFERFAGLAKINNPNIKHYRISCISGEHQSIKQVRESEIIVASVSSLYRNKEHLKRVLRNNLIVVVDEAHHASAATYDDIIRFVRKTKKNVKLLGLTATPVRMSESDTAYLMKLFGNNIIYSVPMANLIAEGILADPIFKNVETRQDFEPLITEDEERLLKRYGELPQTLIGKIAASHVRNGVILKEYFDHSAEYGKTLIFALNQTHCRLLVEELRENGVRCAGIWSGNQGNSRTIQDFKDGKLDVLVNVNIMTEGTDVPDIQTVFLTRPTQSEGFLMQMIGRGMRGVSAGGTQSVNIVDFHDKWETFNRWLSPEWVIMGECGEPEDHNSTAVTGADYDEIDWKLCRDAYKSLVYHHLDMEESVTIPSGWYSLIDEEGLPVRMLVFDNQREGIEELLADCDNWKMDLALSPQTLRDIYFPEMGYRPSLRDIELLVDNVRNREAVPRLFEIEGRTDIDPTLVFKQAENDGEDVFAYAGKVYNEHPMAADLFGDREKYIMAVCKAKVYENQVPIGAKVEELPIELIPFSREPVYDINELAREVIDEQFDGSYEGISSIVWTRRAYRSYFGIFYPDDNSIKINCVLNSKDVPREVVKFVVYHELLHRDIQCHNKEFRRREHLYPNYTEHEHFLSDHMNQCDIKEW